MQPLFGQTAPIRGQFRLVAGRLLPLRAKGERQRKALETKIRDRVHKKIRRGWDECKVLPYVQRHEFETLLFADVAAFLSTRSAKKASAGSKVCDPVSLRPRTSTTTPTPRRAKRILEVVPSYNKVADGPVVAAAVGLEKMRAALGQHLQVDVDLSVGLDAKLVATTIEDLRQALDDLEIATSVAIEQVSARSDGD